MSYFSFHKQTRITPTEANCNKEPNTRQAKASIIHFAFQELEKPPDDDIHGWRTHAWVLILPGFMDVAEPFFIEPSEGKGYPLNAKQYHQIESVYNSENYYVSQSISYKY